MNPSNPATSRTIQRFAWMVALLVVLRFAAADLHQVLEHPHGPDEHCEICLVFERAGDGVTSVAAKSSLSPGWPAPQAGILASLPSRFAPCPPARGPPSSLS